MSTQAQPPFNPSQNTDLILQNLVVALGALNKTLATVLPLIQSTAATASTGGASLPSAPAGFINTTVPGFGPAKVPFYNP